MKNIPLQCKSRAAFFDFYSMNRMTLNFTSGLSIPRLVFQHLDVLSIQQKSTLRFQFTLEMSFPDCLSTDLTFFRDFFNDFDILQARKRRFPGVQNIKIIKKVRKNVGYFGLY